MKKDSSRNRLIFIGGSRGVGKHALAKKIQNSLSQTIIINKNVISSAVRKEHMSYYDLEPGRIDRPEYIYKIMPLERKQLDVTIKHILDLNHTNLIVVDQFFEQFCDKDWIEAMEYFGKIHQLKVDFMFIEKDKKKNINIKNDKRQEGNAKRRDKINTLIKKIKNTTEINNLKTSQLF